MTPIKPFLSQVRLATWHSGWGDEEAAVHLALALEGKALQVLLDLAPAEQRDLQALTTALERRFGQRLFTEQSREQLANRRRQEGESLGTFAADVRLHTQQGYPQFNAAAQEELALHAFLQGLMPERLRLHVRLARPMTLNEAICEAEQAEVILSARPAQQKTSTFQPHIRMADCEEEAEEVCLARPPPPRHRPPRKTDCCYRCGEPGHRARNCPAPTPKSTATQPAENYSGVV